LGQGVTFTSGGMLWAAIGGVALAGAFVAWGLVKRLRDARTLSPGTAPKSFRGWWGKRGFIARTGLFLAALTLIGVTMADPRGGARDERVNFGGKDVEVVVDVSHSTTYAEDGRAERMRAELHEFITRLQGTDRVGLVVFAGQARTASPISVDYSNFEFKIDRLDVESRGLTEGSDLAGAVRYAAERFDFAKRIGERDRIMIVISDGDVSDAEIAAAVTAAQQHHVTIYAIGVGSPQGSRIIVPNADGNGSAPLVDSRTGQPATTRLVEGPLRTLAERTGGAYFRSGQTSSIDRILREVAAREQGHHGDVIKSPRPIGVYLLWPALALLLLESLLAPASLLRRPQKKTAGPKKDDTLGDGPKPGSLNGFAALGVAALIPLGAWPQILPFAVLGTVVAGLLAVEAWTGGRMTRAVREAWQRRSGFVEAGVARDIALLFELRAADEEHLTSFVGAWRAAKGDERAVLIRSAAADEALWREKLVAAYLAGSAPETAELVLSTLGKAGRAHSEDLAPIVARASSNQGKLSWTNHSDAAERFSRLRAAAAGKALALPEPPAPAPRKATWRAKMTKAVTALMLAIMLAGSIGSGVGTYRFTEQQAVAREQADRIFFADDQYVFTDRYVDGRIPELVLPALRHWYSGSAGDRAAMERALQVLRESPDPKADNILVLLFKRGDVIPLSDRAQTTLLTALMERENDEIWVLLDRAIAESGERPGAVELLKKLVIIGAELGTERSFLNLFHVLKSPNAEVRSLAAETLYASLNDVSRADQFYSRLSHVQERYVADPMLQLWTAQFALRHLSTLPADSPLNDQARVLFDHILGASTAFDAARAQAIQQAAAQSQGQAQIPDIPAFLPTLIGLMQQAEQQSMGPDGSRPVPPSLKGMSRYVVNQAITKLIQDGEAAIPGLHERLVRDGVVNPDSQGYSGGYEEYEERGYGGYGSGSSRSYRQSYKLSHLRTLAADLQELGGAAAQDPQGVTPALIEYLTRAGASLEPLMGAGRLSGMLEGGTPGERAAEALFPTLRDGVTALGNNFLYKLRETGLAPAVGEPNSILAYPETLDAAGLQRVRGLLMERVRTGQGWAQDGSLRPLTWSEKVYLARALTAVDDAIRGTPATAASDDAFFASVSAPGEEAIALARLKAAIDAHRDDAAYLLRAESVLIQRLQAAPASATAEDLQQVMPALFEALAARGHEADAWRLLAEAVAAQPQNAGLRLAVVTQANATTRSVAEQGKDALGSSFAETLLREGVMSDGYSYRSQFNQRHIRALRDALAAARASSHGPAQLAAARIAPLLNAGYQVFPGSVFLDEARARGFALNNGETAVDRAYPDRYSRADLQRMLAWARQYRARGVTHDSYGGGTRAFTESERETLDALIAGVSDVLAHYPASGSFTAAQRDAMMTQAERDLYARSAVLEQVLRAASTAGVAAGDSAGEVAVDRLAGLLFQGYQMWPGQVFLEDLRAQGLALNNGLVDRVGSFPSSYSRADVQRLYDFLLATKAAGVTRQGYTSGTRPLSESEKRLLDRMIDAAAQVLRDYPQAPAGAQPAHALLALPFLALAPVIPVTWLVLGALAAAGLFAAWAVWAGLSPVEPETPAYSAAGSGRFKRLEVAAARLAKSAQWGAFRSRAKGDGGLEYAESREFEPGDTLRDVDWIEYAQTGELRTKVFDQEREMPLMLVVDLSKSGEYGTRGQSKARLIEDVAATLAFTAGRTNMRVGAVLFTDRVEAVIPPGGGRAHAWRVAQAIMQAKPEGRATDIRKALEAAVKSVKTRAVVAVLSDFLSDADFKDALASAGARHDLRLIRVTDPSELRPLPEVGLVPVEDAETGAAGVLDTGSLSLRRDAAAAIARRESRLEDAFAAVRTRPILLSTEGDAVDGLAAHFQPKTKLPVQPD
jgi:hypothetical protein